MKSSVMREIGRVLAGNGYEQIRQKYEQLGALVCQNRLKHPEKQQVRKLVKSICAEEFTCLDSASLRLNKFVQFKEPSDRYVDPKKYILQDVCRIAAGNRRALPFQLKADLSFELVLEARMMVDHAGRVLENAGVSLHRFFNIPQIPGSAIKGIARHYAWEQWKNEEPNQKKREIAGKIAHIFGYPTGDNALDAYIVSENLHSEIRAGSVVFLPAYPTDNNWELVPDVLTPHGGEDYKDPVPSFFLAVAPGCKFSFRLRTSSRTETGDIEAAEEWLRGGLSLNGAGAKTAAGYGRFRAVDTPAHEYRISLSTPAFLGGARQDMECDTELRIPSLRGMLRWWWRTLYRGVLNEKDLKALESEIWGSTAKTSLIRLHCKPVRAETEMFDYKDSFDLKESFASAHDIDPRRSGLLYLAYGMDERDVTRYYVKPGASWDIQLSLRNSQASYTISKAEISAEILKEQFVAALSLVCTFGGLGSRSRKGFGSMNWDGCKTLEECIAVRDRLLSELKIGDFAAEMSAYSFESCVQAEVVLDTDDSWRALDGLGRAVMTFASSYKHRPDKAALGLPRKIHGPRNSPMKHQQAQAHQRPEQLRARMKDARSRFSAPVWYHLSSDISGKTCIRAIAFPSDMLTTQNVSSQMLEELLAAVKGTTLGGYRKSDFPKNAGRKSRHHKYSGSIIQGIRAKDEVEAILLEERTKKGGWKVEHPVLGKGPIQNSSAVPENRQPGDRIKVIVAVAKEGAAAFKYRGNGES